MYIFKKSILIDLLAEIAELLGYPTQKEFCPLSDKYVVSYNTINPSADHCMLREGGLNTCNTAAVMDVRFQHCQGNSSGKNCFSLFKFIFI